MARVARTIATRDLYGALCAAILRGGEDAPHSPVYVVAGGEVVPGTEGFTIGQLAEIVHAAIVGEQLE